MRPTRLLICVVLLLIGLVWIGQGSGVLPGSVMSGNAFWAVVGLVFLAGGLLVGARELKRRP